MVLIREASVSGEINIDWNEFKLHLKARLDENFQYFLNKVHAGIDADNRRFYLTSEDKENLGNQLDYIHELIENMEGIPFTFQRLCELLIEPDRHHPTLPRYFKAILKLCQVSTKDVALDDLDQIDVDAVSISLIDVDRARRAWSPGVSSPPPPKRQRSESPVEVTAVHSFISLSSEQSEAKSDSLPEVTLESNLKSNESTPKANGNTLEITVGANDTMQNGNTNTINEEACEQNPTNDQSAVSIQCSQSSNTVECNEQAADQTNSIQLDTTTECEASNLLDKDLTQTSTFEASDTALSDTDLATSVSAAQQTALAPTLPVFSDSAINESSIS